MTLTLAHLLADPPSEAPAIGAPGRPWLSYGDLRTLCTRVGRDLAGMGIEAGDRVAIVLGNGPEMATAFLGVAQVATAVPLNPAYTQEEFDFFLADAGAKAIILGVDGPRAAEAAAAARGLEPIRLMPAMDQPAGLFTLEGREQSAGNSPRPPTDDDVALILHTSGTTARPKIVPLTQANIALSARNVAASLALGPADRCLNIMPLFHIHGLVGTLAASLAGGAQITCAPGFDPLRFFADAAKTRPTWFSAVPTMHQALLARAERNRDILEQVAFRFVRSSSAALPAPVMEAMVKAYGAPVIEAYGMTEAAHQMCANPLPPGAQKPGRVGLPTGPDVQIADERADRLIDSTHPGEVVISGPTVTSGYENNTQANAASFFEARGQRWFRTGDRGLFDDQGYLQLSGRLKELINRGGEKISPLEIDAALLRHGDVCEAAAFAIPDVSLGEDIAAVVVLAEGAEADAAALRAFLADRLAPFKIPRRIVFLETIPKGPTGKVQRVSLAKTLGLID